MAEDNKLFDLDIIAPDRMFYQGKVYFLEMKTSEGEIGVFRGHVPTTAVLVASNALISLVRGITPDRVRIPIYIVIVASFVTLIEFVIKAYFPSLYESLFKYASDVSEFIPPEKLFNCCI